MAIDYQKYVRLHQQQEKEDREEKEEIWDILPNEYRNNRYAINKTGRHKWTLIKTAGPGRIEVLCTISV